MPKWKVPAPWISVDGFQICVEGVANSVVKGQRQVKINVSLFNKVLILSPIVFMNGYLVYKAGNRF